MADPPYIAVTPETHRWFTARQDQLNLGSDEFVRKLLMLEAADVIRASTERLSNLPPIPTFTLKP